jgi:hypothetical protein
MLLRRRRPRTDPPTDEPIVMRVADARIAAVHVFDGEAAEAAHRAAVLDAWRSLRQIVAEALILQDAAEQLLLELRDGRNLGAVAPPCGTLMARLGVLGRALPVCGDPEIDGHTRALRTILDHHVLMLNSARALLASEWRSERLTEQIDRIDGLGPPARRLERIRAEILRASEPLLGAATPAP